nr:hypothetical protein [Streptomyces sp. FXJ1.172]WEP01098.1 hypothetical protein A6P39_044590 [Streptomyces sp. FXJ1.172]
MRARSRTWLGSVVPGAFAGPWTPLPLHFPARIRFVVAQTVRAGKRRVRVPGGGRYPANSPGYGTDADYRRT